MFNNAAHQVGIYLRPEVLQHGPFQTVEPDAEVIVAFRRMTTRTSVLEE
jgi:hypothetical protein